MRVAVLYENAKLNNPFETNKDFYCMFEKIVKGNF